MGSKFSTSLVSINTRRNPKVFSRMVSEAQDTVVDRPLCRNSFQIRTLIAIHVLTWLRRNTLNDTTNDLCF